MYSGCTLLVFLHVPPTHHRFRHFCTYLVHTGGSRANSRMCTAKVAWAATKQPQTSYCFAVKLPESSFKPVFTRVFPSKSWRWGDFGVGLSACISTEIFVNVKLENPHLHPGFPLLQQVRLVPWVAVLSLLASRSVVPVVQYGYWMKNHTGPVQTIIGQTSFTKTSR